MRLLEETHLGRRNISNDLWNAIPRHQIIGPGLACKGLSIFTGSQTADIR